MVMHEEPGAGPLPPVVLVTGGGRGIGRAVALAFAAGGARVAVAARTESQVASVARECGTGGAEAIHLSLDITDPVQCVAAVDACIERWGSLDVLVNNAGSATSHKFTDITDQVWNETLAVDLSGAFYMTRAALPAMLAQRSGCVIAIASIAGKVGGQYIAPYTAAKHGLVGMMRALAAEYPRNGVTFNSICPAYVDTPMTDGAIQRIMDRTGRTREEAVRALYTPQGRLVRPEEVAALCVFLASEAGRGINGQAINVDGGAVQW